MKQLKPDPWSTVEQKYPVGSRTVGKVVSIIEPSTGKPSAKTESEEPETEVMDLLVEDYAEKIRKKRESLGINQKEFAKKLNEKESLIQKIEAGHFEPSIGLAKKIGKVLQTLFPEIN